MRILVVDDDKASRRLLQGLLHKQGYQVELAVNGKQALERLQKQDIRVVMTDMEMPVMGGSELCKAIRCSDFRSYIYIMMMASQSSREHVVEGLSCGADDFVSKPFDTAELLMRLRSARRISSLETLDMTIFAMAKLAEMRDVETGRHVERVARYSRVLARELARLPKFAAKIDTDFIQLIYQTSPLHDIGKIAIPDAILRKPGQLSDAEYGVMKTHTTIGASTIEAAIREYPDARFLHMARDIAATHHERWDGSGYPNQLKRNRIPLEGRIVALADVYDAMTSSRSYKPAFAHAWVKRTIVEASGSHFDPDIVKAFIAAEDLFIEILTSCGEQQNQAQKLAA